MDRTTAEQPAYWIFQARPDRYDLLEGSRLESGSTTRWSVNQHKDRIRGGDFVFLWRSLGEHDRHPRGIWGWGVASEDEVADDRMPVTVMAGFSKPFAAAELQEEKRLARLSILRQPAGTNFPVTAEQAQALCELIHSRNYLSPPDPKMISRLSSSTRIALGVACRIADTNSRLRVHLRHMILGLAHKKSGRLARDLESRGVTLETLAHQLLRSAEYYPSETSSEPVAITHLPRLSPGALQALLDADGFREMVGQRWLEHDMLLDGVRALPAPDVAALDALLAVGEDVIDSGKAAVAGAPQRSTFLADSIDGGDKLGVESDAKAMASIIASRDVVPPLAIGLFGDWGSGKSFFMDLVKAHVRRLCSASRAAARLTTPSAFCQRDIHITFNAWHYADANLWAGLVSHIFESAAEQISLSLTRAQKRDMLVQRLNTYQQMKAEAQSNLAAAQKATHLARTAHESAVRSRELADRLLAAGKAIGLKNAAEMQRLIDRSFSRFAPLVQLVRYLVWRPRMLLLLLAGLAAVVLSRPLWGVLDDPGQALSAAVAHWLRAAGSLLAVGLTAIEGTGILRAGRALVRAVTSLHKTAEPKQAGEEHAIPTIDPAADREQALQPFLLAERTAARRLSSLQQRHEAIRIEIEALSPHNQLRELIQHRTASDSPYRQAEGLIAQIRRDFRNLAEYIEAIEADEETGRQDRVAAPDRIVLYVDDLDRCSPRQVVEVLQAVHLLLAFPLFVVVVAVDPRWLLSALRVHYPELLLSSRGDETEEHADEPAPVGAAGIAIGAPHPAPADRATPRDYLEKIFQIPYVVPPMGENAAREFMRDLLQRSRPVQEEPPEPPAPVVSSGKIEEDEPTDEKGIAGGDEVPEIATRTQRIIRYVSGLVAKVQQRFRDSEESDDEAGPIVEEEMEVATDAERDDEQAAQGIDPDPPTLELTTQEHQYLEQLGPVFRTPRAAKRFVNVYRLLRATVHPDELAEFKGDEPNPGSFREVALLLAFVLDSPDLAPFALRHLEADPAPVLWSQFLSSDPLVRHAAGLGQESALNRLQQVSAQIPFALDLPLDAFRKWAPRVGRFTFAGSCG